VLSKLQLLLFSVWEKEVGTVLGTQATFANFNLNLLNGIISCLTINWLAEAQRPEINICPNISYICDFT
jgi:hypothetical protein